MKTKFLAVEFILKVRNKVFLPCPPPSERISAAIPKTESDMSGGAKKKGFMDQRLIAMTDRPLNLLKFESLRDNSLHLSLIENPTRDKVVKLWDLLLNLTSHGVCHAAQYTHVPF